MQQQQQQQLEALALLSSNVVVSIMSVVCCLLFDVACNSSRSSGNSSNHVTLATTIAANSFSWQSQRLTRLIHTTWTNMHYACTSPSPLLPSPAPPPSSLTTCNSRSFVLVCFGFVPFSFIELCDERVAHFGHWSSDFRLRAKTDIGQVIRDFRCQISEKLLLSLLPTQHYFKQDNREDNCELQLLSNSVLQINWLIKDISDWDFDKFAFPSADL